MNSRFDVLIHPIPSNRGSALVEAVPAFDDEFVQLLEEDRREQRPMQEREEL